MCNTGMSEDDIDAHKMSKMFEESESLSGEESKDQPHHAFSLRRLASLTIMKNTRKAFAKGDSVDRAINLILSTLTSNKHIGKSLTEI